MSAEEAKAVEATRGNTNRTVDNRTVDGRLALAAVLAILVIMLALRTWIEDQVTSPVGPVALPTASEASISILRTDAEATRGARAAEAARADATLGPRATAYTRAVRAGGAPLPSPSPETHPQEVGR